VVIAQKRPAVSHINIGFFVIGEGNIIFPEPYLKKF